MLLDLPAVTIRDAHERPEGMGMFIMCGLEKERMLDAVQVVTTQHKQDDRAIPLVQIYAGGRVSKQVPRIVIS